MVPCQLELGGKDPLYVADDVTDIEALRPVRQTELFITMGKVAAPLKEFMFMKKFTTNMSVNLSVKCNHGKKDHQ